MNIRRDASELYFCLAFVISKSSVSKVSVPSSKRRVADVHGSRESCHDRHRKSDDILRRYGSMHATSSSAAVDVLG